MESEGISFRFIGRESCAKGWKYKGFFFVPTPAKMPAEPKANAGNALWDIVLDRAGIANPSGPDKTPRVGRTVIKHKRADQPDTSDPGDTPPAKPSLDWTWPAFFNRYVKHCMKCQTHSRKRRKRGIEPYREAVGHWKRLTRNPTLGDTTRDDCDQFVRRLFRLPGRRGKGPLPPVGAAGVVAPDQAAIVPRREQNGS